MKRINVTAVSIFCLILALVVAPACQQQGGAQTGKQYSSGAAPANTSTKPEATTPLFPSHPTWVLNHEVYAKDSNLAEFNTHAQSVGAIIAGSYSNGVFNEEQAWKGLDLYFTVTDAKKYAKKN